MESVWPYKHPHWATTVALAIFENRQAEAIERISYVGELRLLAMPVGFFPNALLPAGESDRKAFRLGFVILPWSIKGSIIDGIS